MNWRNFLAGQHFTAVDAYFVPVLSYYVRVAIIWRFAHRVKHAYFT